jgi:regulator of replication initiation timing
MNEEHDSLSEDQTIKGIITDLRLVVDQLGNNFVKATELIHELARHLDESKLCERDQVSRKIKKILKDKISEGKITAKWIEDCLPPEYKRKYTTKSEDTSLSKENMKVIELDASGSSIVSAATSDADPNNIVENYEGRPPDVEKLNTDASPVGKDLEEEIKKSTSFATADQQLSEQATVVELKTEIERLQSDIQSKSDENFTLHIQVKDLKSKLEAGIPQNQEDKSFDVQFQYPYDPLQRHMASSFKKRIRYVPFTAKVDPVTKRIFNVQIHEENHDSEQII